MGSKRKRPAQEATKLAPAAKKHQKSAAISEPEPPLALEPFPFVDNPKGEELKREVKLYDVLSSEDSSERIRAASAIVSGLLEGEGVDESTLQRHLERRLFRGLASGRKGARLGFSIVITEILSQLFGEQQLSQKEYQGLTFATVLEFLILKTKPEGDLSGQEQKDHFLGLLFGLKSFVRAKILSTVKEAWGMILDKLLDLAKKKPWIREECGSVILEALQQTNQAQAEETLDKLYQAGLALSPEGVGVWLTARTLFPKMSFPTKPWGPSGNPLDRLQSLSKALKESSSNDDNAASVQQAKQSGSWNPQLHSVWGIVLSHFASAARTEKTVKSDFENFWKVAVDDNLFSATASRERKFWGFLLFQKILQEHETYSDLVSSIFSHNLVRCIINHAQDQDRFLHRSAEKSLKILTHTVEAKPQILSNVLPGLIGGSGTYNFDKMTKTKTIEKLLATINDDNAAAVIELLAVPALSVDGSDPVKEAESRRTVLGDYLLNAIRRVNMTEGAQEWIADTALPMLAKIAYSDDLPCDPPISERTRGLFQNRLMSVFTHVLSDLSSCHYPCDLLQNILPDAAKMDSEIIEAKDQAMSTMMKLLKKAKKSDEKAPMQALALLYALVIFQLYNGESDAISTLEELGVCYDKLIRHKERNELEVEASEILVELLLSFVSKPSALLRRVAQLVFQAFVGDMTEGGLKLMTDVLQSSESLRGQQEMFDHEPEDEEMVDAESEDMGSDVEVVDMDQDEGELNGHLEQGSDLDVEDSEDEDDEEAQKLDEALAKVLGTHGAIQDLKEDESDSDADMTDSEMMEMDSKIVEIFSQRKKKPNKKQEQKDAKETMVNFKSRVLDLLEIYVKKQSDSPLAFGLLLPLLQLIRSTKTHQLAEKAHTIIISFAKAARKSKPNGVDDISKQIELMKSIHLEASKGESQMFAKSASTASLLIASQLYRADKDHSKHIVIVYADTMVFRLTRESKINQIFFDQFVNWSTSRANAEVDD